MPRPPARRRPAPRQPARRPRARRAAPGRAPARRQPARRPRARRAAAKRASPGRLALATALRRARPRRRLLALLVAYLLGTGLVGWQLVSVQVVDAAEYRGLAERQIQREVELPASRGKLYDRAGQPLAMSLSSASVYANPQAIRDGEVDPAVVAAGLAPVLDRPATELVELLGRDVAFVYLGRQLPREVGERVATLRLPGVGVLAEPRRVYPAPGLASPVLGLAGTDNTGLAGLELQYDDLLAGEPGRLWLERAPGGLTIGAAPREVVPATPGSDLVLTLDRQVQWHTEDVLDRAVERFDAKGAAAVVMDARTGELLAMASSPRFDPTRIAGSDEYARRNRAVTDVFEPGSVNKVVTAAAALEEGLVRPDERFRVPDHYQVGATRFRDASPHEVEDWTFADIIARSSNVGTIMVAQRLGDERLHAYLQRFGYGRRTGLAFPGESGGVLPPPERWWESSLPTISIGQGVSATLLQVAGVFGVIASGGELVEPRLLRGTVDADGRMRALEAPHRERVVSEATAAALSSMLVGVVEEGTGGLAAVPGYAVAGKTGTAQKPSPTSRGYLDGAYVATFAGMAPAEDPALVVAVMIDEPTPYWGSQTAAPTFREIMEFALGRRRVPPSDPATRASAVPAAGAGG